MSSVVKEDGAVAELSEESLAILGAGESVKEDVVGEGTDADASLSGDDLAGAVTAEAAQDADVGSDTGLDPAVGLDDGGGVKEDARWYGDDDIELAGSYGLTADQLDSFSDAEDFRKAAMFFDGTLKRSLTQPTDTVSVKEESVEDIEDIDIDPEQYASEGYGENELRIVRAVQAANKRSARLERELAEVRAASAAEQQRIADERHNALVDSFHLAVDSLGDDLFGDSRKNEALAAEKDSEQGSRRFRLYQALKKYGSVLGDAPMHVRVKRVKDLEFGDEIRERDKRLQAEKIAGQSRRRRPVAATSRMQRAVKQVRRPPENPNDVSDILDDAEFQATWDRFKTENGE